MATVTGVTAERMQEILDEAVETASIEGSTLIFTRHDGSSFAAGDFQSFIDADVAAAVTAQVPAAVSGGVTAKGNVTGALTFTPLTPAQMVNRVFTATLTGNITINVTALPTPAVPGTQFAMVLKQDATGNRSLTLSGIKRAQGVLSLSSAANAVDIVSFMYDGTTWYAGLMGLAFS
jgi:hypothetical protein